MDGMELCNGRALMPIIGKRTHQVRARYRLRPRGVSKLLLVIFPMGSRGRGSSHQFPLPPHRAFLPGGIRPDGSPVES